LTSSGKLARGTLMRSRPLICPPKLLAASKPAVSMSTAGRAWANRRSPASVNPTLLVVREKRGDPILSSRLRIA
jgi:hypothetical protein